MGEKEKGKEREEEEKGIGSNGFKIHQDFLSHTRSCGRIINHSQSAHPISTPDLNSCAVRYDLTCTRPDESSGGT